MCSALSLFGASCLVVAVWCPRNDSAYQIYSQKYCFDPNKFTLCFELQGFEASSFCISKRFHQFHPWFKYLDHFPIYRNTHHTAITDCFLCNSTANLNGLISTESKSYTGLSMLCSTMAQINLNVLLWRGCDSGAMYS